MSPHAPPTGMFLQATPIRLMTTPTLHYYLAPRSPWTYLGHRRVRELAAKYGVPIELRPFDLAKIFPVSGGLQLAQRPPQRQAYRLIELERSEGTR
ncbi:MAG: DsbA family protein, partial [Pigmentiphaga sp.]